MKNVVKTLAVLGVTATLVACGGRQAPTEPVQVVPIQPEPVTTKY